MSFIDFIRGDPFWRGYLCGATVVLILVAPVLFLNSWELHSLRRRNSAQQQGKDGG